MNPFASHLPRHGMRWLVASGCLLPALCAEAPKIPYDQRPEVHVFIQDLAKTQRFDVVTLGQWFAKVHYSDEAVQLVTPPSTPGRKSWRAYRKRFVERTYIRAGRAFWRQYAATLAKAEKEYGVPAEIIVGILGVETIYGQRMGRFPVFETLTTLAFDYPDTPTKAARASMFRQELTDYLIWCRDTHQDAFSFTGSYTGAIGIPQFLPSSIRAYAVDYDHDGVIDLRNDPVDAIGSVASFLKSHGWEAGRPVLWGLPKDAKTRRLAASKADGDPMPKLRLGDLVKAGLKPSQGSAYRKAEQDTKVLLVDLTTPNRPTEYQLGLQNFYVITRYNKSFFYAMAVVELGRAVKAGLNKK